eukprot:7258710-Heterocapsa_arctica.AAC.1
MSIQLLVQPLIYWLPPRLPCPLPIFTSYLQGLVALWRVSPRRERPEVDFDSLFTVLQDVLLPHARPPGGSADNHDM